MVDLVYTNAAPSFIGNAAKVLNANNEVLREGNNGWTYMPGNTREMPQTGWSSAHHAMPVCADLESLKWMQAYLSEEKPELMRGGFMWMLHRHVGKDNTTPMVMEKSKSAMGHWIEFGPHLMIMPKDP